MKKISWGCSSCGAVGEPGPFCSQCGSQVGDGGDAHAASGPLHVFSRPPGVLAQLTPAETAVATGLVAAAVILLLLGAWLFVLVLSGILLAGVAFLGSEHRRTSGGRAVSNLRDRARYAASSAQSWTRAGREVVLLRHRLRALESQRRAGVYALGEAALAGNDDRLGAARDEVAKLDAQRDELDAQIQRIIARTRDGVGAERLTVQSTQIVSLPDEPDDPTAADADEQPSDEEPDRSVHGPT